MGTPIHKDKKSNSFIPLKIVSIQSALLKVTGYATSFWTEKHFGKNRSYGGREDYLATITYLFGSENTTTVEIPTGTHNFNFSCQLPGNCPTSFEAHNGHIRYSVQVVLVRPWKRDQIFTKGFTVLNIMDLNQAGPLIRLPTSDRMQNTYCCWPCRSEPLKLEVTLAQSGFVPGQTIPVTALVINDSNIPVEEITVSLVLVATFLDGMTTFHSYVQFTPVATVKGSGVPRNCTKSYNYKVDVPATPPTCVNLCKVLHLTYEIQVELHVKGAHANQILGIPVTIGNIPLANIFDGMPSTSGTAGMARSLHSTESTMEKAEKSDAKKEEGEKEKSTNSPWNSNSGIPPPNYSEAVHMPHARFFEDGQENYGDTEYKPVYPVFDILDFSTEADTHHTGTGETHKF